MNKPSSFLLFFVIVLFTLMGCSHAIKLDITRFSSDIIHCEEVFGPDLKTLRLENAILLQTGVIDTTDEQTPISVAIIFINNKQIILNEISYSNKLGNKITSTYKGEGYKLYLNYNKQLNDFNETIFKGRLSIEYKSLKSEYEIEGTPCKL